MSYPILNFCCREEEEEEEEEEEREKAVFSLYGSLISVLVYD